MLYEIVVPGHPVPQPRHKTVSDKKTGKQRHIFNTARVKAWKTLIATRCGAGMMPRGYTGCLTIHIEFRFLRPKSHFGPDGRLRGQNADRRVFKGQVGAQACGDGDNLEKAVWDALQAKGVFEDDSQIWDNHRRSYWTCNPDLEGTTIRLWTDEPTGPQLG